MKKWLQKVNGLFSDFFYPKQGWSKSRKTVIYTISVVLVVLLILSFTIWRPGVEEKTVYVPAAPQPLITVTSPPITVTPPPLTTIVKETAKEVVEIIRNVTPPDILDKIKALETENANLKKQIAETPKTPAPLINQTDVIGTITGRQALDLIRDSCPKTSTTGGLRAVEFMQADLISEELFKNWLAQDKTELEALGDSWDYIAAFEYKLRLQPGGKNIPIGRARLGDETVIAVILYDAEKLPRLYFLPPLNEQGIIKINPASPNQIIEYVHLD